MAGAEQVEDEADRAHKAAIESVNELAALEHVYAELFGLGEKTGRPVKLDYRESFGEYADVNRSLTLSAEELASIPRVNAK